VFLKDIPILRRVAGTADPRYITQKFYDNVREVEQLDLQIKELRNAREFGEANRIRRENIRIYRMLKRAKDARKRVKDFRDRGLPDAADRAMRQFNRRFVQVRETADA
jgi:hypothetical protein